MTRPTIKPAVKATTRSDDSTVTLNDDAMAWLVRLQQIRAQMKFWKDAEDQAKEQIRSVTNDATVLLDSTGREVATDRVTTSRRVDTKMLRDLYPDQAEACTVVTETRTLKIMEVEA